MFEDVEDDSATNALRAGLVDLPTPEVSRDFDARIQSALTARSSWQQVWWNALRPALPATALTLAGMLLLLQMAQQPSVGKETLSAMQTPTRSSTPDMRSSQSEAGRENMDLQYASLSFFGRSLHRGTNKSG